MTKKTTVASETLVENLKEFTIELHHITKNEKRKSLMNKDEETFVLANVIHNISHGLIAILKGKTAEEALERIFENEEDDDVVGAIAVNLETGDFQGIENIENPELKKQLVSALNKLTEQLEDE